RSDHPFAGKAEDGEIDRVRDLAHRGVAAHAGDGLAPAVDWIDGAVEAGAEDVAEKLSPDRAGTCGCPDDGNSLGREERPQRGADGNVISLVDTVAVAVGPGDRERDLDLAALEVPLDLESGVLEDAQHRTVVRQHFGHEALYSRLAGPAGQLLEQPGAHA